MVKISAAIDPFVAAAGDGRTPQGAGEWRGECRKATMEISQLRSGWAGNLSGCLFALKGQWIPPSRQDGFRWGEAPDTLCLANFHLSLRDEEWLVAVGKDQHTAGSRE
jgi:hypothetical protein